MYYLKIVQYYLNYFIGVAQYVKKQNKTKQKKNISIQYLDHKIDPVSIL